MAFEKFKLSLPKRQRGFLPQVTIKKTGIFAFNNIAILTYQIGNYKYVIFYYDRENNKIGFKLTNDDSEEGIQELKQNKYSSSIDVFARTFFNYYKIDLTDSRKYDLLKNDDDEILYINL